MTTLAQVMEAIVTKIEEDISNLEAIIGHAADMGLQINEEQALKIHTVGLAYLDCEEGSKYSFTKLSEAKRELDQYEHDNQEQNKTLFDVLDGIVESDYTKENLAYAEAVMDYAEGMQMDLTGDQAESVIRVGNKWLEQRENGNGEWSRMREEAKAALTCYMHTESGDVAAAEAWEDDFNSADCETWFGKPASECHDLHWLDDQKYLVEVEWNPANQAWEQA